MLGTCVPILTSLVDELKYYICVCIFYDFRKLILFSISACSCVINLIVLWLSTIGVSIESILIIGSMIP